MNARRSTISPTYAFRVRTKRSFLHVALPSEPPPGPLPVLVLIHEFFGLGESIVAKAQLLADDLNCLVIAPDTFRGTLTDFIPQAIWLALSTPQDRVNKDLDDWLAWAASPECGRVAGVLADTKRIAVMGFCYGGGKAIRYTTEMRPDAATVVWYGSPLTNPADFAKTRAPICGVFGADDIQIPQALVTKFREALEEADIEHEVVSYYGAGPRLLEGCKAGQGRGDAGDCRLSAHDQLSRWLLGGKESSAKKRAFLEFQLNDDTIGEGAVRTRVIERF